MKTTLRLLAAACFAAFALPSQAQQLNWGSSGGSFVVDSDGDGVDDSFVFELGAFPQGFNLDENEPDQWAANWMLFDATDYNPLLGRFSGEVFIGNGVTSSSTRPNVSTDSFTGLTAYLWIRNSDQAIPGSEWLLVRADNWVFPEQGGDCCTTSVINWSISDLDTSDVPNWGWQNVPGTVNGIQGPGEFTDPKGFDARSINAPNADIPPTLQTHTFIPEPSSSLLLILGACGLVLVRRRD